MNEQSDVGTIHSWVLLWVSWLQFIVCWICSSSIDATIWKANVTVFLLCILARVGWCMMYPLYILFITGPLEGMPWSRNQHCIDPSPWLTGTPHTCTLHNSGNHWDILQRLFFKDRLLLYGSPSDPCPPCMWAGADFLIADVCFLLGILKCYLLAADVIATYRWHRQLHYHSHLRGPVIMRLMQ